MRGRTLVLLLIAVLLAGGTAVLVHSRLTQQPAAVAVGPAPVVEHTSVLVARVPIARGQLLKRADLHWEPWPNRVTDGAFIVEGTKPVETFAGWVARDPFVAGEPIIRSKIVAPGDRGFLAAVLRPGMRAVSVPLTATSGISGFVFPGDKVDILITYPFAANGSNGNEFQHKAAETVLRDVRVIAIDQKLDGKSGEAILAHTATLEVTPKQSEIIAVAGDIGKLSLSLRSLLAAKAESSAGDTPGGAEVDSVTLDSDVSGLIPKPFGRDRRGAVTLVTILRGGIKSSAGAEFAAGGPMMASARSAAAAGLPGRSFRLSPVTGEPTEIERAGKATALPPTSDARQS